jgi:F1F0 ATPase subunit 2
MTKFLLVQQDLVPLVGALGAWLTAGTMVGTLYFLTLRWNVRMLADGRSPLLALTLQLARFASIAGVLAIVALHFGALPLLVVTAGILAARIVFVRWSARS